MRKRVAQQRRGLIDRDGVVGSQRVDDEPRLLGIGRNVHDARSTPKAMARDLTDRTWSWRWGRGSCPCAELADPDRPPQRPALGHEAVQHLARERWQRGARR